MFSFGRRRLKRYKITLSVCDKAVESQKYVMDVEGLPDVTPEMARKEPMRWLAMQAVLAIRETYPKLRPIYEERQAPKGEYHG